MKRVIRQIGLSILLFVAEELWADETGRDVLVCVVFSTGSKRSRAVRNMESDTHTVWIRV